MKSILLYLLLTNTNLTVVYNTPSNQFLIVDVQSNPIQILVIEENYETIPTCLNNIYNLQEINFTNNSTCLMNTLNKDYHLSIQHYVDLKNEFTNNDFLEIKNGNLTLFYEFLTTIQHSYTISDIYQIYLNANKNEFQFEIHSFTYFIIDNTYIPIAYPLNGLSKVITE